MLFKSFVFSGGDMKIFIWNVGKSTILTSIDCHPEVILSVSWNYNGSRIVTSCKDKIFRVINPRTGQIIKVKLISQNVISVLLLKLFFSQEWAIKVQNQQELFIYVMVEFFQLDFRECLKDNMLFGMRFVILFKNHLNKTYSFFLKDNLGNSLTMEELDSSNGILFPCL